MFRLAELLVLAALSCSCFAFLTAVSNIKECINDGTGKLLAKNGSICNKKLIVAMTVQADEVSALTVVMHTYTLRSAILQGKANYLQANIRRVHDSTNNQNLNLKTPVRIKIFKSPVFVNYRLYQVGVS